MEDKGYSIEIWSEKHPKYQDFLECLKKVVPDQLPFVEGDFYRNVPTCLYVATFEQIVIGFLRIAIQPIGPEANCPPLTYKGKILSEAKIHAFAVREEYRNQGVGRALQEKAISLAKEKGCHQLSSYSPYQCVANHQVKLGLGFAAQPETHTEADKQVKGVYFIMPLI